MREAVYLCNRTMVVGNSLDQLFWLYGVKAVTKKGPICFIDNIHGETIIHLYILNFQDV